MSVLPEFWLEDKMRNNILLENELFYCEHISDSEEIRLLLDGFTVQEKTGQGLVTYLKKFSISDEEMSEMRTYLVRDKITNELVGYFSLKAGLISVNEISGFLKNKFDCLPGIELANFAVNSSYKELHQEYEGIGAIIFSYFILPLVKHIAGKIGVTMLYIFALPYDRLIHHYEKLHFRRLSPKEEKYIHRRIKPRYDANCIFMCQPVPEKCVFDLDEMLYQKGKLMQLLELEHEGIVTTDIAVQFANVSLEEFKREKEEYFSISKNKITFKEATD